MPKIKTFKDSSPHSLDKQVNKWLEENEGKVIIHQFLYGGAGSDSAYIILSILHDEVQGDMFGDNIKQQQ